MAAGTVRGCCRLQLDGGPRQRCRDRPPPARRSRRPRSCGRARTELPGLTCSGGRPDEAAVQARGLPVRLRDRPRQRLPWPRRRGRGAVDGRPGQGRRRRRVGAGVVGHGRAAGGRPPAGRGRRPARQRPRRLPARGHLLLDRAVPDHPFERARAAAGALETAPGLLGPVRRPGRRARRAAPDPLPGHHPARLLLPRPRRRARQAATAGRPEQRQRRPHLRHGPVRRVGGPGARLPRHDLRRPRPAGGPVPAAAPVPPRLGGGADPGGGRDGGQAGRRPGPDRADRRQPGRLLGAARPRLRAPLRGRGRRPRRGRRVHLLAGAAARLHARPAPGPVQEGRLRQGDGLDRAVLQVDPGDPALPGRALRRGRRLALRPVPGGHAVPAGRRGQAGHHAAAHHRARGRAVLAGPVTGPPRPAARPPGAGQVHGRRGRQPPLRADGLAVRDTRVFDWLDPHLRAGRVA
jgi:hypothetical protein